MRYKIYIDTSVIGSFFDEEFEEPTKRLFERIENGDFEVYFSEVNETELSIAPRHIRDLKSLFRKNVTSMLS